MYKRQLKGLELRGEQGRLVDVNAGAASAGVSSVPAYWLLDPAGKIVAKAINPDELGAALGKSLGGSRK